MPQRRHLLRQALAASTGLALAPWARLALSAPAAGAADRPAPRLVLVLLRGGLDGLTAVPAVGDPAFAAARGPLAQFGTDALPLAGTGGLFAMHPLLGQLHGMYGRQELAVVHAVGLPYRERSHFDAQNMLETGGERPDQWPTGWLGRALAATTGAPLKAVALDTGVPLVLRGPQPVDTWAPSTLPEPDDDLVDRLGRVYAADAALGQALQRARQLRADGLPAVASTPGARMGTATSAGGGEAAATPPRAGKALLLARQAAGFLQRGSQVAVLEMGGWDSHANQAAPQGALSNNLRQLDAALAALRDGLLPGSTWAHTVCVVATEFGRQVAVNGTLGTDHGSGGAALVLGGAVQGGQVLADWPGLARAQRFEGRDLRTTTDLRALLRTVLAGHLGLGTAALDREVLPGSAGLAALPLLRDTVRQAG